MDLQNLTLAELEQGWHQTTTAYACNYCDATFTTGQVFADNDQFYPADQMVQRHVAQTHPDAVDQLIHSDSKYNTLTAKQRALLTAFRSGAKDATIAQEMHVAAATIRHQKFTFREKAKQAKLYLAIYEQVFNQAPDNFIRLPEPPTGGDERFVITTTEYQALLAKYFLSTEPLRLARWPKHQKAILAILKRVTQEIPVDQHFTESQLTDYLKPVYADFPLLRRYLVDYGFLNRQADGSDYWRNPAYKE